jgi:hypothetical protein
MRRLFAPKHSRTRRIEHRRADFAQQIFGRRHITSKFPLLFAGVLFSLGAAMAVFASGVGGWSTFPSPNGTPQTNGFNGVACPSESDCWAVGIQSINSVTEHTLTEHWDGTAWNIVTSPNTNAADSNVLYGMTCASASECWAVGFYQTSNSNLRQTLILKWNGSVWKIVASPNGDTSHNNVLYGVACVSASQCWAVGNYNNGTADVTLIEKWNGTSWKVVASPNVITQFGNYLNSITCASTSECWADGYYYDNNGFGTPLIEGWNGTSWSLATSAPVYGVLESLACAGTSDCWAAGSYANGNVSQTLFEHWNGTAWSQVAAPSIAPVQRHLLLGLTCASSADCWAVGFYDDNNEIDHTLIEHWDGSSWSLDPNSNESDELQGIACPSTLQCWAAGLKHGDGFYYETLAEKYFPPLSISSVSHPVTGHFVITGHAAPGSSISMEASPDLVSPFQSVGTVNADTNGEFQFEDPSAASLPGRFYHAFYP